MMLNCDKFFIRTLQEAGYDLDYNKVVEIYRKSRQIPACQARKRENEREREAILSMMQGQKNK